MQSSGTSQRVPFELLIGDWVGVGIVFYPNGAYYSHISSRVRLTEHTKGGKTFLKYENFSGEGTSLGESGSPKPPSDVHELFDGVARALCRCNYEMTFEVNGKTTKAIKMSPSIVSAVGYMSTNDNYSFIVRDKLVLKDRDPVILTLHNNHYFPSSNTRQVFGTIADPDDHTIMLTSFIYTSYTPPAGHDL